MGGGGSFGSVLATIPSNHHASFHDMLDTYEEHGTADLSLWLTNAKEAAIKITEATRARQKQKEEKYNKFLRDLHSRVAVSSKQKNFSRIPQARPGSIHHAQIDSDCNLGSFKHDSVTFHEGTRNLVPKDLPKHVPKMDKVRAYLEKQLCKNSKGRYGISKLHRECMIQALLRDKAVEPMEEKACSTCILREECKSAVPKETDWRVNKPFTKPFIVPLLPATTAQMQDVVISEPCTPKGWNLIPTSFSALEMRSVESAPSPTASEIRETKGVDNNSLQLLSPTENAKHLHEESLDSQLPQRCQSSVSRCDRVGHNKLRGKENARSSTSMGIWVVNDSIRGCTKESLAKALPAQNKQMQSECDYSGCSPSLGNEGVTTCSLGVVVLKGRDEYEVRGQGKQFFSDVWKCTMDVERRCAHERAHSLRILKVKRLEQQKAEKRLKLELLREKSIAKQREAVQMELKSVAALKERREGIVQRHRAVEKKRFGNKSQNEENLTILDHVEDRGIEGCDADLIGTQQLLSSDTSKTWLKLQALHKQLYSNLLAEKKWMKH